MKKLLLCAAVLAFYGTALEALTIVNNTGNPATTYIIKTDGQMSDLNLNPHSAGQLDLPGINSKDIREIQVIFLGVGGWLKFCHHIPEGAINNRVITLTYVDDITKPREDRFSCNIQ